MPSQPGRGSTYADDNHVDENNQTNKYLRFLQHPLVINWGWLLTFTIICICNGFLIKQAVPDDIVKTSYTHVLFAVYMAIFPLTASIYHIFKKTGVLISFLLISRVILAFAIFQLHLPSLSFLSISLYGAAALLFAFILIDIGSDRGLIISGSTLFLVIILTSCILIFSDLKVWESVFRITWYCNLIVTANKSAVKLRSYLDNYDSALLTLTAGAAIALSIGWILGSIV
ncbi:MAG: hypothetical protein AAF208_08490 [Cyanobacteria bacterium P01_A01_bin.45]